jgi:2-phosphoglycolate phosphatase
VVFDFDGTLVDSESCIRQSLTQALADQGVASAPIAREWIGLPLQTIIRSACGELEVSMDAVVAGYRKHYAVLDPGLTFAFPGIVTTLQALDSSGVRLAVATNKHSTPARATLDRLDISRLFTTLVGAENVDRPKPHPDIMLRVLELNGVPAAEALMVGDAAVDLQMAAAAGVDSCAVTWGNSSRDQLEAHAPTYVIESPAQLLEIVVG